MATTTNFGWETPDDTDLVKDGAAAMRTLGNSIDASFVDLKGGTTNQVLAKNSNTDLDFKWVADATGIPATIIDAKGDLIAGTAADTAGRLGVGANGTVLTADSGETTGLKWATPAGAKNFSLLGTGTLTGAATITVSGISGQDILQVLVKGASSASGGSMIAVRFNSDTASNYKEYVFYVSAASTYNAGNFIGLDDSGTYISVGAMGNNAAATVWGSLYVVGCNTAGKKMFQVAGSGDGGGGTGQQARVGGGFWDSSSTVSSVSLVSLTGNFDAGTFEVYGSA